MVTRVGGKIGRLLAATESAGYLATMVGRTAIYGVRRSHATNAGTAPARRPAVGLGLHSVWEGPRQIRSGAPILKRDQRG